MSKPVQEAVRTVSKQGDPARCATSRSPLLQKSSDSSGSTAPPRSQRGRKSSPPGVSETEQIPLCRHPTLERSPAHPHLHSEYEYSKFRSHCQRVPILYEPAIDLPKPSF